MTPTRPMLALMMVLATALALPAEAKNDKGCPPGLAKKAVPCVPPGQAKKMQPRHDDDYDHVHHWHRGDRIYGDYVLIPRAEWERLRLRDHDDGSAYLRIDNQILRVARDTLVVIEAVRILDRVLN
jgi:Ni/Co efflux regulator RcnB